MYGNAARAAGVKIPDGQLFDRSDKPSLTLTGLLPLQFHAMRYVDNKGQEVAELVVQAGDEIYMAPDGAQWLAKMRPLSAAMKEKVIHALQSMSPSQMDIPTQDNVDVVASEISQAQDDPDFTSVEP